MLASGSFFADIVIPSARAAIFRTMLVTETLAYSGSLVFMNHAFSAKRQASRKSQAHALQEFSHSPIGKNIALLKETAPADER